MSTKAESKVRWSMEYPKNSLDSYKGMPKKDIILFTELPEKQLNIFDDLKTQLPEYEFVVCLRKRTNKK